MPYPNTFYGGYHPEPDSYLMQPAGPRRTTYSPSIGTGPPTLPAPRLPQEQQRWPSGTDIFAGGVLGGASPAAPSPKIGLPPRPPMPPIGLPPRQAPAPAISPGPVYGTPNANPPMRNEIQGRIGDHDAPKITTAPHPGSTPYVPSPLPIAIPLGGGAMAYQYPQAPPVDPRRQDLLNRMNLDYTSARDAGDFNRMAAIAANQGHLDRYGYEGLDEHLRNTQAAQAESEFMKARTASAQREANPMQIFEGMSPEQARVVGLSLFNGDETMANSLQAAVEDMNAKNSAMKIGVQGAPQSQMRMRPAQIENTLKNQFGTNNAAALTGLGLPEMYSKLEAWDQPGWQDPHSLLGRTLKEHVRSSFPDNLAQQLNPTPTAAQNILSAIMPSGVGPFAHAQYGPTEFERKQKLSAWWRRLNQPPAEDIFMGGILGGAGQ